MLKKLLHPLWMPFQKSRLNSTVLGLAIPVTIQMINHTLVMVADTKMVGVLGKESQAATSFGGMTYFTVLSFLLGSSIATQILIARRFGEKDYSAISNTIRAALSVSVIGGVVLSIIGFLIGGSIMEKLADDPTVTQLSTEYLSYRSIGTVFFFMIFILRGFFDGLGVTRIGMISSFLTTSSNVLFNYILIYGNFGSPAMGVKGAAIASALSGIPGVIVFLYFLFLPEYRKYLKFENPFPPISVYLEWFKLGAAPSVDSCLTNLAFVFFSKLAGMVSTTSLAASGVVITIMSLSFMPGYAFGVAATTILGQSIGAKKFKLGYIGAFRSAHFSAYIMGFMGVLFLIFGRELASWFSMDQEVIHEVYKALIIVSVIQVGDAYHMVIGSTLRSAGHEYWVMATYLFISYGIFLPYTYIAVTNGGGIVALWFGVFLWLFLLSITFVWKFSQRDWEKLA